MTAEIPILEMNAATLVKVQSADGTWPTPSASTDALYCEPTEVTYDPTMVPDTGVNPSLDQRASLPGGMKVGKSLRFNLKGSGVPGVAPESDAALRAAGLVPTTIKTDLAGTDFSFTTSGLVTAASTVITALTKGTPIFISGAGNSANNGEFLIATTGLGTMTVTQIGGAASGMATEASGASVTISYGIPAVDCTAGSATTFTAQSPWSNTAEIYKYAPVLLSGNPSPPVYAQIMEYTSARVATIDRTLSPVLSTSTRAAIPPCIVYMPASTNIPKVAVADYAGGRLWQLIDCAAESAAFTWNPGATITGEIQLRGKMYADESDSALPDAVYDDVRPGLWLRSTTNMNKQSLALNALKFSITNTVSFPPDARDNEGFGAPLITGRDAKVEATPNLSLVATRDNYSKMRNGVSQTVHSSLLGGNARNAGQRIFMGAAAMVIEGRGTPAQEGRKVDALQGKAEGFDSGMGIAFF